MATKIKRYKPHQHPMQALAVAFVVVTVGSVVLFHSKAATPVVSIELENGTTSGTAAKINDATASNGQAVRFGTTVKPPVCTLSALDVPASSCGALWGAYVAGGTYSALQARESMIGRHYAMAHIYHDFVQTWPTADDKAMINSGHILAVEWEPRAFSSSTYYTYSDILAGIYDSNIDSEATRIKALGSTKIFLSFEGEPEDNPEQGTPAQYNASWQYVYNKFKADGVTNVIWAWNVMGNSSSLQFYPGDAFVDWIAYDPYNWYKCNNHVNGSWMSPQATFQSFYDLLNSSSGPGHQYSSKPYMITETGSDENDADPTAKENWFKALPSVFQALPNLKILLYYDTDHTASNSCSWNINSSPNALAGYIVAGNDPFFSYGK